MGSGSTRRGLIALFLVAVAGQAVAGQAGADCLQSSVELRSGTSVARFNIELADSDAERAQGLMNRAKMAASAGMLFVYDTPRRATFWMKDTLLPLDMIFADATGLVTRVHANAKPLDTTTIDGGDAVTFVLEINGGLAKRLGIAEGSVLRHPLVDQSAAVWPCDSD